MPQPDYILSWPLSKTQTTVAKHFATHNDTTNARVTIYIMEYIVTLKDAPSANSLRDNS